MNKLLLVSQISIFNMNFMNQPPTDEMSEQLEWSFYCGKILEGRGHNLP